MTVGTKLHQTLASLESAVGTLKSFSLDTQDQNAKQQFDGYARQLDQIVQGLKARTNYVESQEPGYKMSPQAKKQDGRLV
ncbi:MAG: DUF1657 domain-containing protein [Firmicutes bacterium]|nr:DUF1657 domain-containing protein [Bacillota bacterium]